MKLQDLFETTVTFDKGWYVITPGAKHIPPAGKYMGPYKTKKEAEDMANPGDLVKFGYPKDFEASQEGEVDFDELKEARGEYSSYASWKAAIKKKHPDAWIDGDKEIASAMVGPKPYKRGETKSVGEWDGDKGELF